jgi:hypothetical protein
MLWSTRGSITVLLQEVEEEHIRTGTNKEKIEDVTSMM